MTIVRQGAWEINDNDFPGGPFPRPFGAIINFTTPYTYQGGSLLLELAHGGFPRVGTNADSEFDVPDAQSIFGTGFNATYADVGSFPYMIVARSLSSILSRNLRHGDFWQVWGVRFGCAERPAVKQGPSLRNPRASSMVCLPCSSAGGEDSWW